MNAKKHQSTTLNLKIIKKNQFEQMFKNIRIETNNFGAIVLIKSMLHAAS